MPGSAMPGSAMSTGGFGAGPATASMGTGGVGGTLSPMGSATGTPTPGSPGAPNSGMPVPNGGSAAFGQPGLDPDIRPGKK
jgi:hypothetical protein